MIMDLYFHYEQPLCHEHFT